MLHREVRAGDQRSQREASIRVAGRALASGVATGRDGRAAHRRAVHLHDVARDRDGAIHEHVDGRRPVAVARIGDHDLRELRGRLPEALGLDADLARAHGGAAKDERAIVCRGGETRLVGRGPFDVERRSADGLARSAHQHAPGEHAESGGALLVPLPGGRVG